MLTSDLLKEYLVVREKIHWSTLTYKGKIFLPHPVLIYESLNHQLCQEDWGRGYFKYMIINPLFKLS